MSAVPAELVDVPADLPIGSTGPGKGRAAQHHFFLSSWSWPWQKMTLSLLNG